jgi:hypothetical protein
MERGQAYTLEGTIGAIVLVTAVLLGLQAVDTGPWTATPDRVPEKLETQADDLLTVAAETGSLSAAVRCYGGDRSVIDGSVNPDSNSDFEEMLRYTFDEQNRNYNLYISYWNSSAGEREQTLASTNNSQSLRLPDASTGVATRQITLYDTMPVKFRQDCSADGPPISDTSDLFDIPDVDKRSAVYNVVEVRLVVW